MQYKTFLDVRRKELVHKRWTDRVYNPIRRQIVAKMNSQEFEEYSQRKRRLHVDYLEHKNKRVRNQGNFFSVNRNVNELDTGFLSVSFERFLASKKLLDWIETFYHPSG